MTFQYFYRNHKHIREGGVPYLYELAEGCIGWVVSDQETHILISNFDGGWTVHNGKQNV